MFALLTPLLFALVLIWVAVTLLWAIAQYVEDNSIMDVFYPLVYLVLALALVFVAATPHPMYLLILMLVMVWALRLWIRIGRKNLGKGEDWRYQQWRTEWMMRGKRYFQIRSYLQVFLLQGLVIFLVSLPLTLVTAAGWATYPWIVIAGVALWCIGFAFEFGADHQLDAFLRDPINNGKIIQSGLFRYCRRPNYFGESLMWWGIAVIAAGTLTFPLALLAFISPVAITYIVYAVTGPMLEKKWEHNFVYQAYKERTNYFIPWFPKSEQ